jgi:hypothetical protein
VKSKIRDFLVFFVLIFVSLQPVFVECFFKIFVDSPQASHNISSHCRYSILLAGPVVAEQKQCHGHSYFTPVLLIGFLERWGNEQSVFRFLSCFGKFLSSL